MGDNEYTQKINDVRKVRRDFFLKTQKSLSLLKAIKLVENTEREK